MKNRRVQKAAYKVWCHAIYDGPGERTTPTVRRVRRRTQTAPWRGAGVISPFSATRNLKTPGHGPWRGDVCFSLYSHPPPSFISPAALMTRLSRTSSPPNVRRERVERHVFRYTSVKRLLRRGEYNESDWTTVEIHECDWTTSEYTTCILPQLSAPRKRLASEYNECDWTTSE